MMRNISPLLNYYLHKLNIFSLLGLGLILGAVLLYIFNISFQQKKLALLKHELVALTEKSDLSKHQSHLIQSPLIINSPMELSKKSELPNVLEFVFVAAKQNNILIDNADYKLTDLPSIQSRSYEINLPVSGKYLDIRKFISQIIKNGNGVVLNNVELSRENSQLNDLGGLLQFIVYMKSE